MVDKGLTAERRKEIETNTALALLLAFKLHIQVHQGGMNDLLEVRIYDPNGNFIGEMPTVKIGSISTAAYEIIGGITPMELRTSRHYGESKSYEKKLQDYWDEFLKLMEIAEKLQVNLRNVLKLYPGLGVNGVKELAEENLKKKFR